MANGDSGRSQTLDRINDQPVNDAASDWIKARGWFVKQ